MNGRGAERSGDHARADAARIFEHEGRTWTARVAGAGAGGTGRLGTAAIVAIHFWPEGSDLPTFEALLPRGRLEGLFDAELRELLTRATPIPAPPGHPGA